MAEFRIEPLGESVLIVEAGPHAVSVAAHVDAAGLRGVVDVVPAFDQVAVYFDGNLEIQHLRTALDSFSPSAEVVRKHHLIPVCYELGEDLKDVAGKLSMSTEAFIELHTGKCYDCKAIGFCPGFPYLGWLDEQIGQLGRLESPRLRVPPGSVAIAGRMTGVYPLVRPGGWRLVGRTPLVIVDQAASYFPIQVGDSVEFQAITDAEFQARLGERL